jgi:hypothetical protein
MATSTKPREVKEVALRIAVTPAMHAAILAEAEKHDVSAAHIVRAALRGYLKDKGQVKA